MNPVKKMTTTLTIAALAGLTAFAGSAQAQVLPAPAPLPQPAPLLPLAQIPQPALSHIRDVQNVAFELPLHAQGDLMLGRGLHGQTESGERGRRRGRLRTAECGVRG